MCQFDDRLEVDLAGGSIRFVSYFEVRRSRSGRGRSAPAAAAPVGALGATKSCFHHPDVVNSQVHRIPHTVSGAVECSHDR